MGTEGQMQALGRDWYWADDRFLRPGLIWWTGRRHVRVLWVPRWLARFIRRQLEGRDG